MSGVDLGGVGWVSVGPWVLVLLTCGGYFGCHYRCLSLELVIMLMRSLIIIIFVVFMLAWVLLAPKISCLMLINS